MNSLMSQEKCNKIGSNSQAEAVMAEIVLVLRWRVHYCAGLVALFSCLTIETRPMMDYRPAGMIITAPTEYITTQDNILQINFL